MNMINKILNELSWFFDYYVAFFLYSDRKKSNYHKYMFYKWGDRYKNRYNGSV